MKFVLWILGILALLAVAIVVTGGPSQDERRASKATSMNDLAGKIISQHLDLECGMHGAFAQHFAELRDLGVSLAYTVASISPDADPNLKLFAAAIYGKNVPPEDEFLETYRQCKK